MKRLSALLVAVLATPLLASEPAAEYVNRGNLTQAPQVNARRFVNYGTITLPSATRPFETSNTEVYINEGTILANPGVRFELINDAGFRRPATLFSNSPAASISTTNSIFFGATLDTLGGLGQISILNIFRSVPDAFLSIEADRLVNRGALTTSAGGEIRLKGSDVDLLGSTVNVLPLPDGNSIPDDVGGVRPIPGQVDTFWHYDSTRVEYQSLVSVDPPITIPLPTGNVSLTNATVQSPRFPYVGLGTRTTPPLLRREILFNGFLGRQVIPFVWITTNDAAGTSITNSTNQVITVVLVRLADTNVLVEATARRGADPNQPLPTVSLRLTAVGTNLITGQNDAVSFTVQNTFGSDYQTLLLSNSISGNTYQPTNILMFKRSTANVPNPFGPLNPADTNAFANAIAALKQSLPPLPGQTSNAAFRSDIFTHWWGVGATNLQFTNQVATNTFVGYGAQFTYQGSTIPRPANVPAAAPTNLAGRVVIDADKLDLRRTRVRAQGPVIIRANDVVTSAGTSIDAPFMDVAIGSSSGNLKIQNLFRSSIDRFAGNLEIFSSSWSNNPPDQVVTVTNAPANPGDPPTTTDVTVALSASFHVMIVDADFSASIQTPFVDLKLNSRNVTISDGIRVDRFASVETENLTIDGSLRILGTNGGPATFVWDRSSFPTLKNLTNNGLIEVNNTADFGDAASPYDTIVNNGRISATGVQISAKDLITSTGSRISGNRGRLDMTADRVVFRGVGAATNSASLSAKTATLGGGAVFGADFMDLVVSESLTVEDSGATLNTSYGVNFPSMPPSAYLKGLTISTRVPAFQEAIHVWPGADVGPLAAGFGDQSIATLDLNCGPFSILTFRPVGGRSALYVRNLIISTNIATTNTVGGALALIDPSILNVEDGMTIYFSAANVPAAQFEALTGGKFKFVDTGAGAGGGFVTATVNGRPTLVSIGLRFSTRIDSDGDGIFNAYDADPFEGVVQQPTVTTDGSNGFVVQWEAAPWGSYEVQYSDNLADGWQTLKAVTNPEGANKQLWIRDPIRESDGGRTYRVLTK